jgi:hypothetical protein
MVRQLDDDPCVKVERSLKRLEESGQVLLLKLHVHGGRKGN